jgi:hypothetical protein
MSRGYRSVLTRGLKCDVYKYECDHSWVDGDVHKYMSVITSGLTGDE